MTGRYDIVVISEAPNDQAMAKLARVIGSWGATRTETPRPFTESEYRDLVGALP